MAYQVSSCRRAPPAHSGRRDRRRIWIWILLALASASCRERLPEEPLRAVLETQLRIAAAGYEDSLLAARVLAQRVDQLGAQAAPEALAAARAAWITAREPYSQTEALRFGHWIVDEWEPRVNTWPVDEGLLDYVSADSSASGDNPLARTNLVAADRLRAGSAVLDLRQVSAGTLAALHGLLGIESNVARGYHAIEFLLWGQDVAADGPGQRPWTDFAADARCTDGARAAPAARCAKRIQVLRAATQLLVRDLEEMAPRWGADAGSYGQRLLRGEARAGLRRMLIGMSRLAAEELAGERIGTALLTGSAEEEQDCFSDQTHRSLALNAQGIANLYFGRYRRSDGRLVQGPALADLAARSVPTAAAAVQQALLATEFQMQALHASATRGQAFDRLIDPGNGAGQAALRASIAALTAEAGALEALSEALGLGALNGVAP